MWCEYSEVKCGCAHRDATVFIPARVSVAILDKWDEATWIVKIVSRFQADNWNVYTYPPALELSALALLLTRRIQKLNSMSMMNANGTTQSITSASCVFKISATAKQPAAETAFE